jgi:hypothetical protein
MWREWKKIPRDLATQSINQLICMSASRILDASQTFRAWITEYKKFFRKDCFKASHFEVFLDFWSNFRLEFLILKLSFRRPPVDIDDEVVPEAYFKS